VLANPQDWQAVSTYKNIGGQTNPYGFLPMVMAVVKSGVSPKDSEMLADTPLKSKYTELYSWLKSQGISKTARAAFFRLRPGDSVGRHVDEGKYYLTKDRFHLSLQGRYLYEVDGEEHIIEPGTFFWFDNKKPHSATNIDTVDRLTFVFDVPYSLKHAANSRNFI
jgi:quercetin dioxygenase-like cupin family protein